ncbi:MAG: hypothetical protein ACLUEQ_10045 [Cloacibacillus evryensis]
MQTEEIPQLRIVLKTDVQGSLEAFHSSLMKMSTDAVSVNIVHEGVGRISESDVMLASASNAIVIGFNVRPDSNAKKIAENEGVQIRLYQVIYDMLDDVKAAMEGMLAPELREQRSARRKYARYSVCRRSAVSRAAALPRGFSAEAPRCASSATA